MLIEAPEPTPRPRRPTLAIVGAGASGTLVAAHALRAASRERSPLRIVLIDRRERIGGVAYSTGDPRHRLNVTAARMSAFAQEPDDFVRWRAGAGPGEPGAYAARGEYRRYLEQVLAATQREAAPEATLARLTADVERVDPAGGRVRLRFAGAATLDADAAVLALGNLPPLPPPGCGGVAAHPAYVNDAWAPGALERIPADERATVLLIGTGLTMVDVAIALARRSPSARLLAVSRGGLLPRAHLRGREQPRPTTVFDPTASLPELVDAILAESAAGNPGWHEMVDAVRPLTQGLWQRLSLAEQADFIATRHRLWCVRRHRMPPEVAAMLATLIGSGRLEVQSGSVELFAAPHGLTARISGAAELDVSLAVNCTGPGADPSGTRDLLVRRLLADGHVRAHPLGLGFNTAPDGSFRTRGGSGGRRLFTLGPPRMGELYETTAIPEIRAQAQELAERLVEALRSPLRRPGSSVPVAVASS
jgi:uncharacterized NAD(P)/FAD-binding protein YdhS